MRRETMTGAAAGALLAAWLSAGPSVAAEGHPLLRALAGTWTGKGSVQPAPDKPRERVRCRADYSLISNGNGLEQSVKCAGTSFRMAGSGLLRFDPEKGAFSGTFRSSADSGRTTMKGRNGGAKRLKLDLEHSGYTQIANTTGRASYRLEGPSRLVLTLSARDGKSGRMRQVLKVTYTK